VYWWEKAVYIIFGFVIPLMVLVHVSLKIEETSEKAQEYV
jgi:hypothetical protein